MRKTTLSKNMLWSEDAPTRPPLAFGPLLLLARRGFGPLPQSKSPSLHHKHSARKLVRKRSFVTQGLGEYEYLARQSGDRSRHGCFSSHCCTWQAGGQGLTNKTTRKRKERRKDTPQSFITCLRDRPCGPMNARAESPLPLLIVSSAMALVDGLLTILREGHACHPFPLPLPQYQQPPGAARPHARPGREGDRIGCLHFVEVLGILCNFGRAVMSRNSMGEEKEKEIKEKEKQQKRKEKERKNERRKRKKGTVPVELWPSFRYLAATSRRPTTADCKEAAHGSVPVSCERAPTRVPLSNAGQCWAAGPDFFWPNESTHLPSGRVCPSHVTCQTAPSLSG